jgi:hypothetical protein
MGICDIRYFSRDATFMVKEVDVPSSLTSAPCIDLAGICYI